MITLYFDKKFQKDRYKVISLQLSNSKTLFCSIFANLLFLKMLEMLITLESFKEECGKPFFKR
ncbi:hypothetical protein D7W09_01890 [bacterium D16-34]|nr:hypothetical protein D7W09_01890 [bacterium D16-34]